MLHVILKSFVSLTVLLTAPMSQADDFSYHLKEQLNPHRREIMRVGRKILKSSRNFDVVAIGRSPTLFSAYLELSGVKVYHLPLTSGQTIRHLDEREKRRFEEYVLTRIPKKRERPILFLDFINTGKSINVLNGLLLGMQSQGLLQDFSYMFLTSSLLDLKFRSQLSSRLEPASFRFLKISKRLEGKLLSHAFDYYAPYFAYRPLDHFKKGQNPQENPMYDVFKGILLEVLEPSNNNSLEPLFCDSLL